MDNSDSNTELTTSFIADFDDDMPDSDSTPLLTGPDGNNASSSGQYAAAEANSPKIGDSSIQQYHKPRSQCFVYALTFLSAIGGFLFGYDTGVISGAMILLRDTFNLTALWQELIVSVTVGFAAIFAAVGGVLNSFFGRKPTILIASAVFSGGAVCMGVADGREVLLVGRIIVGIGIGKKLR